MKDSQGNELTVGDRVLYVRPRFGESEMEDEFMDRIFTVRQIDGTKQSSNGEMPLQVMIDDGEYENADSCTNNCERMAWVCGLQLRKLAATETERWDDVSLGWVIDDMAD